MKAFEEFILEKGKSFAQVVDFDPDRDKVLPLDFTIANTSLSPEILADTDLFTQWVAEKLAENGTRYGIGGYNEHRTIYARSEHFDGLEEPRRLHLGVDIWGPAGTPVYNFYDATVHSFNFNNNYGDYGATIILAYQFKDLKFFALYGHLNLASLNGLTIGEFVPKGKQFASFGVKEENGYWPPHLHFQLVLDMQGKNGDYPGVCQFSKRDVFLENCPDPALILKNTFAPAMH